MQKITIVNFGPIKTVQNLPIHNIILLIGQQASGKSTISKLIYFFKSLKEDVFQCLEEHQYVDKLQKMDIEQTQLKVFPKLKSRFYTFFGSTKHDNFSLTYEYKENLKVTITPDENGSIQVDFSDNWYQKEFYDLIKNWNRFLHEAIKLSKIPKTILNGIDDLVKKRRKKELGMRNK
jgi:predicted ATPase